jgi:colanic acid biosynthesis glycosyl transferase WcaI
MRILLVTICYPPEIRSISIMMRELADSLSARGHEVCVLTSWPQYNLSAEARQRTFTPDCMEGSVRVLRVKTLPTHKVAYVLRGVAQVMLPMVFLRAYDRYIKESPDVVMVYTPHLPLTKVGAELKRRTGARFVLNVQDIFPQNAIDLGILRNQRLIAYFERMEQGAYSVADAITVHTPGSIQFLQNVKNVPEEKLSLVPNWIDVTTWDRTHPTGEFRRRFDLVGKFVFLFAGILGPAQRLDFLLDVATRVSDLDDVVLLFVGDGTEKPRIMQRANVLGLTNVQFESFVDPGEYPQLVKEMDVGLVCLDPTYTTSMVPGKVHGYMAAGIPVLAFLNEDNDGHALIAEAQCGWSAPSNDVRRAALLVRRIFHARRRLRSVGARGRAHIGTFFEKELQIDRIEALLADDRNQSILVTMPAKQAEIR